MCCGVKSFHKTLSYIFLSFQYLANQPDDLSDEPDVGRIRSNQTRQVVTYPGRRLNRAGLREPSEHLAGAGDL